MEPRVGQDYVVHVGKSLNESDDESLDVHCSFRYEFQPASVDTRVPGLVSTDSAGNTMVVSVAHANAPGGIEFKGKVTENKDIECILIFDPETDSFTLEKLPLSCAQLRHVRKSTRPSKSPTRPSKRHQLT
ncbi:hypothetical protein H310_10137 [Aphanomyces invadans]|uniref:Transcription elongation factor Eaf N-terminal domain-containing protein n=1 Tax=Aphanomyces invadans TaxID=157072 RepID=A0A024TU49_9STRA|nr:hypothetical protein H310_10137 [Aphanomyces invadans]ETV96852.1 hypothetical protein H310_10137 [Aphanomyces invadans]|eukprot:XP_008874629.1 hypothetical protein H310_10137 [Aphanomyces invadans]